MRDEEFDRSSQPKNPKKKPFSCKIAVFEEQEDPNKRKMYPKHLVYADGKDIQLEEIRAMHYWNKVKGTRGDSNFAQVTKSFRNMSTQTDPEPEKSTRVVEACTQTEAENSYLPLNSKILAVSPTQSQQNKASISNEQSNEKTSVMVLSSPNDANTSNVRTSEENLSIPESRCANITVVLARRTEASESNVQSIQPRENPEIFKPASESNFHPEIPQAELSDSPTKDALHEGSKLLSSRITTRSTARARLRSKTRSKSRHNRKNIEKELPKLKVLPTPSPIKIEHENLVDDEDDSFTTRAMKLRPTSTPATPFEKMKNKNQANRRRGGKY